jgi:GT2 family glycosyltransferase
MTDVSVIIVSWNTNLLTRACLASVFASRGCRMQVIVVDNGSTDGSRELLAGYKGIELIQNEHNLGFSKPNNQGIQLASGRYVLLLNSDTVVQPEALLDMVKYLDEHPEAGGLGPRLQNGDGSTQREGFYRKLPSVLQVLLFYTPIKRFSLRSAFLTRWLWEDFTESDVCAIDQIPGAALMVRRSVLDDVGLLEEKFAIWFEDVDWCYRAKQKGYQLFYYPLATITHYGGQSFAQWQEKSRMLQLFSSLYLFFRLHKGRISAEMVRLIIISFSILSILFDRILRYAKPELFDEQEFEARKWFIGRFWRVGLAQSLPPL